MDREPSFSGLLHETAALIGDGIRPIAIFVVVMSALSALGAILGWSSTGQAAQIGFMLDTNRTLVGVLYQLFLLLASLIAGYLLLVELLKIRGRFRDGPSLILPYIGLSILTALGIVVGLVLLIVPGVILMVRWSAATGFLAGGRMGVTESLSESWRATQGHSWPIFFAGLVVLVAVMLAGGAIGAAGGVSGSDVLLAIVSALAEQVGTAVTTAFTLAVYVLVSNDHDELGEVFG